MVDEFHFGDSNTDYVNFSNCIFWDIGTASTASTANSPNTTYINVTVGDVNAQNTENTFTDRSSTDLVYFNNSIFYDIEGTGTESCPYRCSRILSLADESSNNLFYDHPNLTVGDTTDIIIGVDPQMTHPVRITPGSNAHTNGVGATVIKRRGSSGTLWDEAGYDEILNDSLWPWPNEDQIKGKMAGFDYNSGNVTVNGSRGFCAPNQTLTKYIWEYLGHPNPYKQAGEVDFILSDLNVSVGTTSANITFTTNLLTNSSVGINGQVINDTNYLKNNSITVIGLTSGSTYDYNITYRYNASLWGNMTGLQLTTLNETVQETDYPPTVTLFSPQDGDSTSNLTIPFNCSATDDVNLKNITLYGNWSGG